MSDLFMHSDAAFSPTGAYRYQLSRIWDERRPLVAFCMLNPSKAGKIANDPTSRRCMGFANAWRCGGVLQCNLFGLRGADPRVLRHHPDPIGPDNDAWLRRTAERADLFILACGSDRLVDERLPGTVEMLAPITALHCLRRTKYGYPEHPLYLRRDLKPIPYETGRAA